MSMQVSLYMMLDIAVARLANHWFCCGYT